MAYALPCFIRTACCLAGLAGFAPDGAISLASGQPLRGYRYLSRTVRRISSFLWTGSTFSRVAAGTGADVTYCEDEVGHKLSADCFASLETFFRAHRRDLLTFRRIGWRVPARCQDGL